MCSTVHNWCLGGIIKRYGISTRRMSWILSRLGGVVRHDTKRSAYNPIAVTISMTSMGTSAITLL